MQGAEIWEKVNESIKVVVWPGVVTFGIILFRTKLGDLFQRLREAATPAGTMKFDPSEQAAANRGIAATAGNLMKTIEEASQPPAGEGSDEEFPAKPPLDMREVKDDVEAVIRASFAAGFNAAHQVNERGTRLKLGRTPRPMIQWDGSTPEVQGYSIWGPDVEQPDTGVVDFFVLKDRRKEVDRHIDDLRERIRNLRRLVEVSEHDGHLAYSRREELSQALEDLAYQEDKRIELDAIIDQLERH